MQVTSEDAVKLLSWIALKFLFFTFPEHKTSIDRSIWSPQFQCFQCSRLNKCWRWVLNMYWRWVKWNWVLNRDWRWVKTFLHNLTYTSPVSISQGFLHSGNVHCLQKALDDYSPTNFRSKKISGECVSLRNHACKNTENRLLATSIAVH